MISPRYATTFCFVQTDARLAPETVELLTGVCVKRSFDRISVDGQLSTSDTVVVQAGGASGVVVEPETPDEIAFGEALDALLRQLAIEIVSDGEGAERIGRVVVRGRRRHRRDRGPRGGQLPARQDRAERRRPELRPRAPGGGPGLAAGRGVRRRTSRSRAARWCPRATRWISAPRRWRALEEAFAAPEVEFELTLPGEGGETEVFFSDLSEGYVRLNATYTS